MASYPQHRNEQGQVSTSPPGKGNGVENSAFAEIKIKNEMTTFPVEPRDSNPQIPLYSDSGVSSPGFCWVRVSS